jgi:tetratricopeptide (TPR) repeat protein
MMRSGCLQLPGTKISFAALTTGTLITAVLLVGAFLDKAADADDAVALSFETEASYTLGPGDSKPLARKLALFRARREAVFQASDRFAQRRLIQFVDRDKNELVHLVTDTLNSDLLQDQCRTDGRVDSCAVRARTVVRLSDFIDAQLASLRLATDEDEQDYRDEMEPQVPVPLRPGHALAKAYRLIDKQELRMAIIYLDRLADRYPNWWEIYDLKAMAFGRQNRPAQVLEALRKACELGSPTACVERK